MANNMNKVILSGRLVDDAKVFAGSNEDSLTVKFRIAVNRSWGGENGQPSADFIDITEFGKAAKNNNTWLKKGRRVLVDGALRNNNYTDKNGNKHFETQVVANYVEFLDPNPNPAPAPNQGYQAPNQGYPAPAPVPNQGYQAPNQGYPAPAPAPNQGYQAPQGCQAPPAPAPNQGYQAPQAPAQGYQAPGDISQMGNMDFNTEGYQSFELSDPGFNN